MPGDDFQQPKGGHHAETFLHQSFLTSSSPVCSWDPEASLAKVIEGGSLTYIGQITSPTSHLTITDTRPLTGSLLSLECSSQDYLFLLSQVLEQKPHSDSSISLTSPLKAVGQSLSIAMPCFIFLTEFEYLRLSLFTYFLYPQLKI